MSHIIHELCLVPGGYHLAPDWRLAVDPSITWLDAFVSLQGHVRAQIRDRVRIAEQRCEEKTSNLQQQEQADRRGGIS